MKFIRLIICIIIVFNNHLSYALTANDVATIDMILAISLHPKMALFDFNRIGFYKVKLGLDDEEFEESIENLKKTPMNYKNDIEKLETALKILKKDRYDFEMTNSNSMLSNNYLKTINDYDLKEKELKNKINDLNWQMDNSDLTSRIETEKIIKEIKNEILEVVKEVVCEEKYLLVINSSLLINNKLNSKIEFFQSQGMPGINYSLFSSFYFNEFSEKKVLNSKWKELTYSDKDNIDLTMTNYPLVLSGGNNILNEVLKRIYKKYNIDETVVDTITSVTERIECLQHGKKIDKLEVILNE